MELKQLENKIKEFKAEVIVGTKKFKGFTEKDVLKILDDFNNFVSETLEKYPDLDNFYFKIGDLTYYISQGYYGKIEEMEKKKIKEDSKEHIGIIKKGTNSYTSFEYILIGEKQIDEGYKEMLEVEMVKNVCSNIQLSNLELKKAKDKFKEIKNLLRIREQNFIMNDDYGDDSIQTFINKVLGIDYKISDEKEENKIFKVLEKENIRLALYRNSEYTHRKIHYILAIPEFDLYNYLDEGRFINSDYNNICIFDYDTNKDDFNLFQKDNFSRKMKENLNFLTDDELQKLLRKNKLQKQREEQKQSQEKDLSIKIKDEFKKNGEITLNSIKRTKDGYFHFQNQKVGFKNYNIMEKDFEEKDFNNMFDSVCFDFVYNRSFDEQNKKVCWLGNFKVTLKKITDYNYIEGLRINKGEVEDVLKKGICFNKLEDYKNFLKEVSKCSIKIHNIINSGLVYNLNSDRWSGDKIFSTIKVIRKNGRHYLKNGDELFKISNINRIMDSQNWSNKDSNTHLIASVLSEFSELSYDNALLILKDGLKGYRLAKKKAKELLDETIKKLDIKKIDVDNSDISGKGYLVTGKSGKKYFIKEDLKVYEYPNFRYICIVDKGQIGNLNSIDLLVSRMFALCNDDVTADKELIYTLNA